MGDRVIVLSATWGEERGGPVQETVGQSPDWFQEDQEVGIGCEGGEWVVLDHEKWCEEGEEASGVLWLGGVQCVGRRGVHHCCISLDTGEDGAESGEWFSWGGGSGTVQGEWGGRGGGGGWGNRW